MEHNKVISGNKRQRLPFTCMAPGYGQKELASVDGPAEIPVTIRDDDRNQAEVKLKGKIPCSSDNQVLWSFKEEDTFKIRPPGPM